MRHRIWLAAAWGCGAAAIAEPSTRLIVAYGDSLTFGTGASVDSSYPSALARTLNRIVVNAGVPGESAPQTLARMRHDTAKPDAVVVLWTGTNDVYSPDEIVASVDSAIALIGHDRYVIMGPQNRPYEYKGRPEYDVVTSAGKVLAQKYPNHFVDIRELLVQHYDRTRADDRNDFANDVPPTSLRSDAVHLNDAGYAFVASTVASAIRKHGW